MSDFRSRVLGTIIGTLSRGSFPKREPVAWETLLDLEWTFADGVGKSPSKEFWNDEYPTIKDIHEGEILRVTINGVAVERTVAMSIYGYPYVGNTGLDSGGTETGEDFYVTQWVESFGISLWVFVREAGTYQIKIERRVN